MRNSLRRHRGSHGGPRTCCGTSRSCRATSSGSTSFVAAPRERARGRRLLVQELAAALRDATRRRGDVRDRATADIREPQGGARHRPGRGAGEEAEAEPHARAEAPRDARRRHVEGSAAAELRKDMPLHRTYFHEIAQPAKIPALLRSCSSCTDTADFRNVAPDPAAAQAPARVHADLPVHRELGADRAARSGTSFLLHAGLPAPVHRPRDDRQRYYESLRLPRGARSATSPSRRSTTRSRRPRSTSSEAARPARAAEPSAPGARCSPGRARPIAPVRFSGPRVLDGALGGAPTAQVCAISRFSADSDRSAERGGGGPLLYRSAPHAPRSPRRHRGRRLDRVRPRRGGRRRLPPDLHAERPRLGGEAARGRRGRAASRQRRSARGKPVAAHSSYLINCSCADRAHPRRRAGTRSPTSSAAASSSASRCARLPPRQPRRRGGGDRARGRGDGPRRSSASPARRGSSSRRPPARARASAGASSRSRRSGSASRRRRGAASASASTPATSSPPATTSRREGGYERTFGELDGAVGLSNVEAFHLNDSKKGLGCRVDRHEHIGERGARARAVPPPRERRALRGGPRVRGDRARASRRTSRCSAASLRR